MRRTAVILWYVLTLRCEEADRVRCLRAEGAASRYERFAESVHSMLCKSCRHARKQVALLDEAIAEVREHAANPASDGAPPLSDTAKNRLLDLARESESRNKKI